jgi:hypothetical protein
VKIIPIFHHDDGRMLLPTARHIWDRLLEERPDVEEMGTKMGAEVEDRLPIACGQKRKRQSAKLPSMNSTLVTSSD